MLAADINKLAHEHVRRKVAEAEGRFTAYMSEIGDLVAVSVCLSALKAILARSGGSMLISNDAMFDADPLTIHIDNNNSQYKIEVK